MFNRFEKAKRQSKTELCHNYRSTDGSSLFAKDLGEIKFWFDSRNPISSKMDSDKFLIHHIRLAKTAAMKVASNWTRKLGQFWAI